MQHEGYLGGQKVVHRFGTGDHRAINNPPVSSLKNADLELNQKGFRGNIKDKEMVSNIGKSLHA